MTKLELELALKMVDKIIDEHTETFEGGDRRDYEEIPQYEIEPMKIEISAFLRKIFEGGINDKL